MIILIPIQSLLLIQMNIKNLPYIVKDVNDYVNTYVKHVNGTEPIHFRKFARKYGCFTLPYFHDILGV